MSVIIEQNEIINFNILIGSETFLTFSVLHQMQACFPFSLYSSTLTFPMRIECQIRLQLRKTCPCRPRTQTGQDIFHTSDCECQGLFAIYLRTFRGIGIMKIVILDNDHFRIFAPHPILQQKHSSTIGMCLYAIQKRHVFQTVAFDLFSTYFTLIPSISLIPRSSFASTNRAEILPLAHDSFCLLFKQHHRMVAMTTFVIARLH